MRGKQDAPTAVFNSLLCRGGASFNCRHVVEEPGRDSRELGPHEPQREIAPRSAHGRPVLAMGGYHCRRCRQYLGCYWCAQRLSELICLRCHDWATDEAEKVHGAVISRELAAAKVHDVIAGIGGT